MLLKTAMKSLGRFAARMRLLRKILSSKYAAFEAWKLEANAEVLKISMIGTRDLKSDLREISKTQRDIE